MFPPFKLAFFASCAAAVSSFAGEPEIQQFGNSLNAVLARSGAMIRLAKLDTYAVSGQAGQTLLFNDRAFKSGTDFVPRDPRRAWSGDQSQWQDDISYTIDGVENTTHSGLDAIPAIRRAMTTWDEVQATTIPLSDYGDAPFDLGYVQFLTTGGGTPFPQSGVEGVFADITHPGFLSPAWFEFVLGPGAGAGVLGVTFTFTFDEAGVPTDINSDGLSDTAFSEVYYKNNPYLPWAVDGVWVIGTPAPLDYDIQTVALHESGHALGQNHFGKAFRTQTVGRIHFAPFAVMNAAYSRVQQTLTGTDIAGHSQLWGSWPNK
jgi:hypothetical protein